ncbi:hypothetical protein [Desulfitobacterium hafniense]|uniref:hypothetical protein n=1 Tax=Desulfitobacterium hafniense TaxID=49338 RepID=UPI00128EBA69|nr:hypothetical protein [Desulfitobacterium hafniense]
MLTARWIGVQLPVTADALAIAQALAAAAYAPWGVWMSLPSATQPGNCRFRSCSPACWAGGH